MNQVVTSGIVLTRTNYQEADRILTLLTPDHGKVRVLARGVRKSKSKMAGGIELFSVAEISFIRGKGELATLTSSRLKKHYGDIVQDINRTMLGYELIKLLNKVTEDEPEADYFTVLTELFEALNNPKLHGDLVRLWFYARLLKIAGHTPNLHTDIRGKKLGTGTNYSFNFDTMGFESQNTGTFTPDDIKFLRLVFNGNKPQVLQQVTGNEKLIPITLQLIQTNLSQHLHI